MPIGIGIDFEDITQTPAYRSLETDSEIPIPFESVTERLLALFDDHDVTATFFVVADLAEQYPGLVREIAEHGHEIASHTSSHTSLPGLSPEEKAIEIKDSKRRLEEIIDTPVAGFRAPTCRIDDEVYTHLTNAGHTYSSSVMPSVPIPGFYSNQYGFKEPVRIETTSGELTEFPLAVHPTLRLPVSGAWIRLFGRTFARRGIQQIIRNGGIALTYSHPWEFLSLSGTPLPLRNCFRTGEWLFETYNQLLQLDAEYCSVSTIFDRCSPPETYDLTHSK